jgi:hypothetical protein
VLARLLLIAAASSSALFSSYDVVSLQLKAPFNQLFDRARTDEDFGVAGTLTYTDGGQPITIDGVHVSVRGNTSKRETECAFPKLKVQFPRDQRASMPLFAGMDSLKIGTHCGEASEDGVTMKFGRLPNEQSPLREAFVHRLLEALGVPALKARPARITYVYADARPGQSPPQEQPIVKHAMLLENTEAAIARVGGHREIAENAFTNARAQFSSSDTARLVFAEALIGNFDWCLKMTPDDTYRCDARHPLWNVAAAATTDGRARPLMHDFDVSGMVTGRHPWFKDVFNEAFVAARSQAEVEVLAQVQRARSLFKRDELNAARAEFVKRKADAYQVLEAATLDPAGKQTAKRYLDSFYTAIEPDDAFYRPVVATAGTKMYSNPNGAAVCTSGGAIPVGTPVSEPIQTNGAFVQVMALDAQWHWAPPATCAAVHEGPVWIDAAAISKDFPKK